jgi:DNA-binding NarL/FixJ family response regulator
MELIATSGHLGQAVTDCGPGVSLLWKPFAATTLARWALDALGAAAPAAAADLVAPLLAVKPVSATVPQSSKVLVIDDDDGVRKYLAELLELQQLAVVQAATAAEGLAAAREYDLQLAIIDVVLPDGDGIHLLDGLREVDPLLPMLIVSGQASVESAQRAMQGRAAGMLLKPIAPDVFQQTVERALKDGQVQRLQHMLLMARSEYQPLVLDLPNTERQFAESLAQVYVVFQPLVRAHDKVVVVLLQELGDDVRAKRVRDATVVLRPARNICLWVGPEQIAQHARVGYVHGTRDALDLLRRVEVGREARVHAKDLLVDDGGEGHHVEGLLELLPHLDTVSPLALVVEAVDAVDRSALVVAAQQEKVLGVPNLVREQQRDGLEAVLPAVDIVAAKRPGARGEPLGLSGKARKRERADGGSVCMWGRGVDGEHVYVLA